MADVQLEHGHVRIANRLVEAILDADFTGAQVRILLALARLTYGWRRRSVSISATNLAELAGLSGTGGFRRAFHDLIKNGVIVEIRDGRSTTYTIQKDFVLWRKFGGNEGKLAERWDKRPVNDDVLLKHMESSGQLTLQGHESSTDSTIEEDDETTPQGQEEKESRPHRVNEGDPTGSCCVTPQGRGNEAKSIFGETLNHGKDKKDRKDSSSVVVTDHQTVASVVCAPSFAGSAKPDDDLERDCEYARGIAAAANNAIAAKWGEQSKTLIWSTATQLAADLRRADIPLELARHAVSETVRASKNPKPPFTLEYFRQPIIDVHRDSEQRALNAADPSVKRGGEPTRIHVVMNADDEAAKHQVRVEYDDARRAAAMAWGKDPEHRAEYDAIARSVTETYAAFGNAKWIDTATSGQIILECAQHAGFPDFDTWLKLRDQ